MARMEIPLLLNVRLAYISPIREIACLHVQIALMLIQAPTLQFAKIVQLLKAPV